MGHTDPAIARTQRYKGYQTVRGRFSPEEESSMLARKEKRGLRNGIHASSDILEAMRELEVWQQYLLDSSPLTMRESKRWHASNLCRVLLCYRDSQLQH